MGAICVGDLGSALRKGHTLRNEGEDESTDGDHAQRKWGIGPPCFFFQKMIYPSVS